MKKLLHFAGTTFFVVFFTILLSANAAAQGVGINSSGSPADQSSMLDVSSNTKGVLLSRMTSAERNAIVNPAEGLIIFNTDTKCFNFFRNGAWFEVCGNCIGPQPPVATNNGPRCTGDTLKLFASLVPGVTYVWTGPNGFSSTTQNPVIPSAGSINSGTYSVYTTNGICPSGTATTTAVVNASPNSSFSALPVSPSINANVTFSPSVNGLNYNWSFQNGNPSGSTAQNPVVQWSATGTYNVTLTVSQNGCSSTTTSQITVSNCPPGGSQTFSYTGSNQSFTVPTCYTQITVEAWGAQGGTSIANAVGGYGAYIKGTFTVTPGDVLTVKVGGKGNNGTVSLAGGGGGGGSFVLNGGNILLIAAGGGGGCYSSSSAVGQPGNASTTGGAGGYYSVTVGSGGFTDNGQGGGCGAGGGGWNSAGTSNSWATGGQAAGGSGGISQYTGHGGWGGGGAAFHGGGGGGGYTGGSGGNYTIGGGGGGSINNGTSQTNTSNVQSGNGQVIITW